MDITAVGLHIHPGLNAVGTTRLDAKSREQTGVAPKMSLRYTGEGAKSFTGW